MQQQQPKHFAFFLHYPSKDKCLMWPGWYEDSQAEIDKGFTEIQHDVTKQIGFHASLNSVQPYKVFVKKTKQK